MRDAPRIAPIAVLPVFLELKGRKTVVVGASEAVDWKAELLSAAGAAVERAGHEWSEAALRGAALAVGDISERKEALRFIRAGRRNGVPINLIDQPELSDFQFGSIVSRSPVIVGISTGGASPMLSQSIRSKIEALLPDGLADWAAAAAIWRPRIKEMLNSFVARRAFWKAFVERAWAAPGRSPTIMDFNCLISAADGRSGQVTLVGAGPGDPGLLTLNALRALQSATVVLYDYLVGPGVLELARREARRIAVGKAGRRPSWGQSDINALMVEFALAGEKVVRLKGGDPMIFGRASEEIAACRVAGIPVEVVPGISAAQGAASSLQISLTERRRARRVQFITGHGSEGQLPADIDWASIADPGTTTIVYMPRQTLGQFVFQALAKGLDPATPAIAIASASLPEESHVAGRIVDIGALAERLPAGAPVTALVGWVARGHLFSAAAAPLPKVLAS